MLPHFWDALNLALPRLRPPQSLLAPMTISERALPQPLCIETKLPESIWLKFQYDSRGQSRSGNLGQSSAKDRARPYLQGCVPHRLHDQYWLERLPCDQDCLSPECPDFPMPPLFLLSPYCDIAFVT
ncbi:hypothetical protein VNO77_23442 [Canavalia gladiata]|uniref:Uncharacterized protein n=1 Tax=Canavalia gladiata TaxID=3824 RepID=A0AAN9L6X2_CANGL